MKVTFKKKGYKQKRSLFYQYGTVTNQPSQDLEGVIYRARRNRITRSVWIKLRRCGWSQIEQPELFVKN